MRQARSIAAAAMLTRGLLGGLGPVPRSNPPLPEKPCVVCGKVKRHNNAFCSAECCRAYRSR
jgi:hypothetical protein